MASKKPANGMEAEMGIPTTTEPTITPTVTLPSILAITGMRDYGPCDEGPGSAQCPHCGAWGRYVWTFLCADGSTRSAMRICLKLFPMAKDHSRYAKMIGEAFSRKTKAELNGKRLASWWQEMVDATEDFGSGKYPDHPTIEAAKKIMHERIAAAESKRQAWLCKNGYGRRGRR